MHDTLETRMVRDILGLDLAGLNFASIGIEPTADKVPLDNMSVFEVGLNEFFACLMVQSILKANIPKESWALVRQMDSIPLPSNPVGELYCLVYGERAANAVEKSIRLAESLAVVISAIEYANNLEGQVGLPLTVEQIGELAKARATRNLRRRDKMWVEIDHGLKLLLSDRQNPNNPEPNNGVALSLMHFCREDGGLWDVGILQLHGHQIRKWIRESQVFRLPSDVNFVTMGHYHFQMAIIRYGLWVIFTGHFKKVFSGKYVLSHLGAPRIDFNPESKGIQFIIDRSL